MWDELEKHLVVRHAICKQRTSKELPGVYIPLFTFKKTLTDICPKSEEKKVRIEFQEKHDVGLVRSYAHKSRGRNVNDENMKAFYTSMVPVAKKGWPSAEQEELVTRYQSCIQKKCGHEERLTCCYRVKREDLRRRCP